MVVVFQQNDGFLSCPMSQLLVLLAIKKGVRDLLPDDFRRRVKFSDRKTGFDDTCQSSVELCLGEIAFLDGFFAVVLEGAAAIEVLAVANRDA